MQTLTDCAKSRHPPGLGGVWQWRRDQGFVPTSVLECAKLRVFSPEERYLAVKERQKKRESQQFLNGWKEIAGYLGKGVRTTQRYERTLGLPVRRPAGKPSGSVIATRAELDGWVKASPISEIFHLRNLQPEYELQA